MCNHLEVYILVGVEVDGRLYLYARDALVTHELAIEQCKAMLPGGVLIEETDVAELNTLQNELVKAQVLKPSEGTTHTHISVMICCYYEIVYTQCGYYEIVYTQCSGFNILIF